MRGMAAALVAALLLGACRPGSPGVTTTTPSTTVGAHDSTDDTASTTTSPDGPSVPSSVSSTLPPSTATSLPTTVPNTGGSGAGDPGPGCGPFADGTVAAIAAELARVDAAPSDLADPSGPALSDSYYEQIDDLRAAAASGGCDGTALTRAALARTVTLHADSPAGTVVLANVLDDLAWRARRSVAGTTSTQAGLGLTIADLSGTPPVLRTCSDVAALNVRVAAQVAEALTDADLDRFLGVTRGRTDDLASQLDGAGRVYDAPALAARLGDAKRRSDELGCRDAALGRSMLGAAAALRAGSPAAAVFLADQVNAWHLLVTGV